MCWPSKLWLCLWSCRYLCVECELRFSVIQHYNADIVIFPDIPRITLTLTIFLSILFHKFHRITFYFQPLFFRHVFPCSLTDTGFYVLTDELPELRHLDISCDTGQQLEAYLHEGVSPIAVDNLLCAVCLPKLVSLDVSGREIVTAKHVR